MPYPMDKHSEDLPPANSAKLSDVVFDGLQRAPKTFPAAITDRLLVEPLEVDDMVRGMARPGSQAERPTEGIVRMAGPGRMTEFGVRVPPEVSVGDLISFPSYAGKEIIDPRGFPPGAYLIVRQDEVHINYGPADAPKVCCCGVAHQGTDCPTDEGRITPHE